MRTTFGLRTLAVGLLEAAEVRPVLGLRSGAEQTRKGKDGKKQFFHRFSSDRMTSIGISRPMIVEM